MPLTTEFFPVAFDAAGKNPCRIAGSRGKQKSPWAGDPAVRQQKN
jgi:hypothetical protein